MAEIDNEAPIAVGDWVYLDDEAWPGAAQFMVLGSVDAIRPKDTAALRNDVFVRPFHSMAALSQVTLLSDQPASLATGSEDGAP